MARISRLMPSGCSASRPTTERTLHSYLPARNDGGAYLDFMVFKDLQKRRQRRGLESSGGRRPVTQRGPTIAVRSVHGISRGTLHDRFVEQEQRRHGKHTVGFLRDAILTLEVWRNLADTYEGGYHSENKFHDLNQRTLVLETRFRCTTRENFDVRAVS
jgi:hypothetical protein